MCHVFWNKEQPAKNYWYASKLSLSVLRGILPPLSWNQSDTYFLRLILCFTEVMQPLVLVGVMFEKATECAKMKGKKIKINKNKKTPPTFKSTLQTGKIL